MRNEKPATPMQKRIRKVTGICILVGCWQLVVSLGLIPRTLLPSPAETISVIPELWQKNHLLQNMSYSVFLNVMAFAVSIALSFPIGYVLGLNERLRDLFELPISSVRYLPMTATIGLFMSWLGIGYAMKIGFLATCLIVFMIPQIIKRIDEVAQVLVDSAVTLGATKWQTFKHVYLPASLPYIWLDIAGLTAISYTYLIAAESVNMSEGGLGALMIFFHGRLHRVDKLVATLINIGAIGYVTDKLARHSSRIASPFMYRQEQAAWRRRLA